MRLRQIDFVNPKHGEGFSRYGLYCPPYGGEIIRQIIHKLDSSIHFRFIDETRGDKVDYQGDVMFGTAYTYPVKRLYTIAKGYRERGKTSVIGGIHVSAISSYPELYSHEYKNADAIVIGEGESILPELIADLKNNQLKPLYFGRAIGMDSPVLCEEPLRPGWGYPIQFLRGCPWSCEFCSVPTMFGEKYRQRPIPSILQEIDHYHQVKRRSNFLMSLDDDINDPKTIYPLLEAVHQKFGCVHGIGWASTSDMNIVVNFKGEVNHRFLSLANKTNCFALYIGFENVNPQVLKEEMGVKKNSPAFYAKLAKACHDYGITVWGSTVISQLSTTWKDVEFMVDWYNSAEIDMMAWTILTPLPSTPLFDKVYREKAVYSKDNKSRARKVSWIDLNWNKYDCCHAVWMPEGATHTVEEYEEMRDWAQRHYIKHPMRSLALAAYRLLRGDTRTSLRRHAVRAFVGLRQSGLIPNGTIERLFFGKQTNKGLTG
jgi:radical SAM superfamily enzyme YgiQ (UPF0313 family)